MLSLKLSSEVTDLCRQVCCQLRESFRQGKGKTKSLEQLLGAALTLAQHMVTVLAGAGAEGTTEIRESSLPDEERASQLDDALLAVLGDSFLLSVLRGDGGTSSSLQAIVMSQLSQIVVQGTSCPGTALSAGHGAVASFIRDLVAASEAALADHNRGVSLALVLEPLAECSGICCELSLTEQLETSLLNRLAVTEPNAPEYRPMRSLLEQLWMNEPETPRRVGAPSAPLSRNSYSSNDCLTMLKLQLSTPSQRLGDRTAKALTHHIGVSCAAPGDAVPSIMNLLDAVGNGDAAEVDVDEHHLASYRQLLPKLINASPMHVDAFCVELCHILEGLPVFEPDPMANAKLYLSLGARALIKLKLLVPSLLVLARYWEAYVRELHPSLMRESGLPALALPLFWLATGQAKAAGACGMGKEELPLVREAMALLLGLKECKQGFEGSQGGDKGQTGLQAVIRSCVERSMQLALKSKRPLGEEGLLAQQFVVGWLGAPSLTQQFTGYCIRQATNAIRFEASGGDSHSSQHLLGLLPGLIEEGEKLKAGLAADQQALGIDAEHISSFYTAALKQQLDSPLALRAVRSIQTRWVRASGELWPTAWGPSLMLQRLTGHSRFMEILTSGFNADEGDNSGGEASDALLELLLLLTSAAKTEPPSQPLLTALMAVYSGSMTPRDNVILRIIHLYQQAGVMVRPATCRWGSGSSTCRHLSLIELGTDSALSNLSSKRLRLTIDAFPLDRPLVPLPLSFEIPVGEEALTNHDEDDDDGNDDDDDDDDMGGSDSESEGMVDLLQPEPEPMDEGEQIEQDKARNPLLLERANCENKDAYDPSFLVPLIDGLLQSRAFTARQACTSGILSCLLMATSSFHQSMRVGAYACLQQLWELLEEEGEDSHSSATFRQRPQVLLLLNGLYNGVSTPFERVPCAIALLLAKAADVISNNPASDAYKSINAFLLRKPFIGLTDLPLFTPLFTGLSGANADVSAQTDGSSRQKGREWILRAIAHGVRTSQDLGLYARKRVAPLCMSYLDSAACDRATSVMVLDVLDALAALQVGGCRYLLNKLGTLAWIRGVLAHADENELPLSAVGRLVSLATNLLIRGSNLPQAPALLLEECLLTVPVSIKYLDGARFREGFEEHKHQGVFKEVMGLVEAVQEQCMSAIETKPSTREAGVKLTLDHAHLLIRYASNGGAEVTQQLLRLLVSPGAMQLELGDPTEKEQATKLVVWCRQNVAAGDVVSAEAVLRLARAFTVSLDRNHHVSTNLLSLAFLCPAPRVSAWACWAALPVLEVEVEAAAGRRWLEEEVSKLVNGSTTDKLGWMSRWCLVAMQHLLMQLPIPVNDITLPKGMVSADKQRFIREMKTAFSCTDAPEPPPADSSRKRQASTPKRDAKGTGKKKKKRQSAGGK
ncbi:unnamed protein product [Chrysoparadoxa australica]